MSATTLTGFVKQVQSGDTIIIRDRPKNRSPNVKTIILMSIAAPRLGRRKKDGTEEKDEPFAWEAREFLRKKLIGQEVHFFSKPFPNASGSSDRELGKIFYPTKEDDIAEELVANGLAKVKREKASGKQAQEPEMKKLMELEDKAKAEGKGLWGKDKDKHVRPMKYPKDFVGFAKDFGKKPVNAIIEAVRTGQFMMILDVMLLPSFNSVPVAINGIKFHDESDKEEARYFVECCLLQQDEVQVVIEKGMNNFLAGSVLHPKGNIAEVLLKEGFMCCDDRTIVSVASGAPKLRAAEKFAKDKKLRVWKNQEISSIPKEPKKEFQGTVCEIIGGEALMIKLSNSSEAKKIFLSSIRSPKEAPKKDEGDENNAKDRRTTPRTIFDVPWLYEAREFLRKKLIGKRVNVIEDYVQGARDNFPQRSCCTVMVGSTNIAEQLVQNGLATVIKHRERDDRSLHYDALLAAESKAIESKKGLYSKETPPKHRVTDCTGNRATGLFPMLQKADRIEGVVEYVMSGSRMRLFIPKDSLMITFLLSGIQCPRAPTKAQNLPQLDAEPFGEEALSFTKERVLQREVEIRIEAHDRRGCMLGTLTVNNVNLALALVEEGLAEVYSSCSDRVLITAEKVAKESKIGIWSVRQEDHKNKSDDDVPDRKVDYKDVSVTIVSPELHIFVHHIDERKALQELEDKLRQEFASNPPVTFSKENPPPKGKWVAAKFSEDNLWYRAKVEKVIGGANCKAIVYFADYGNRQHVPFDELAPLPEVYAAAKPYAHEYALACVTMPPEHYLEDVALELVREITGRTLGLNIEYYDHNLAFVTLVDSETKEDVNKTCIEKGFFYVQRRREKKLQALIKEYDESEVKAKKERALIWEYGDAREDDAKEFGLGK